MRTSEPRRVGEEAGKLLAQVHSPGGLIAFVGGSLGAQLHHVARAIASACPGTPALVASGAWVLHEAAEFEDDSAAVLLAYSGSPATFFAAPGDDTLALGHALAQTLQTAPGNRASAVLLLCSPEHFAPDLLIPLTHVPQPRSIFGAGTIGVPGAIAIDTGGTFLSGAVVAMLLYDLPQPKIDVSPAARLLTAPHEITAYDGSLVLELDGVPALEVLQRAGDKLAHRQVLCAALVDDTPAEQSRRPMLLRPIRGVDPQRGGLFLTAEIHPNTRMCIAAQSPTAAREDLETMARQMRRSTAGAAPRFGVYLNCAARGSSLYGSVDVDRRLLHTAFPDLPLIGLSGAFELAPHAGVPRLHMYTGVLTVFTAPS